MFKHTVFAGSIMTLVACANSTKAPAPDPPLATCVLDVWLENADPCACGNALVTTPECSAGDCREGNTLVLKSDGTSGSLILRWSESRGTLSAVGGSGAILRSHWQLVTGDDPRLVQTFDATKTTYDTGVKCTSTQLVRTGKNTYDRAAPSMAKGMLSADGTSWQGISYRNQ